MKFEHIIWDWNGTLFNDAWLCLEVINSLLDERGLPIQSLNEYKNNFDFPVVKYYELLGFDLEKEKFEVVGAEFINRYEKRRQECKLHESVRPVLEAVSEYSSSQSILSAYEQNSLEGVVAEYEISDFFTRLVGHHDIYAPGKIENGKQLITDLNADKSDIILIGDTVHDHEVAESIGISCLLIENGHHSEERLKACGVPLVKSLDDAVSWLNQ